MQSDSEDRETAKDGRRRVLCLAGCLGGAAPVRHWTKKTKKKLDELVRKKTKHDEDELSDEGREHRSMTGVNGGGVRSA